MDWQLASQGSFDLCRCVDGHAVAKLAWNGFVHVSEAMLNSKISRTFWLSLAYGVCHTASIFKLELRICDAEKVRCSVHVGVSLPSANSQCSHRADDAARQARVPVYSAANLALPLGTKPHSRAFSGLELPTPVLYKIYDCERHRSVSGTMV